MERLYRLTLSIHSLDKKGLDIVEPVIKQAAEDLGIEIILKEEIFKKKELRNYKQPDSKIDGSILIYRNNGRLLVTDRNGIFDDFIRKMCQKTCKDAPCDRK